MVFLLGTSLGLRSTGALGLRGVGPIEFSLQGITASRLKQQVPGLESCVGRLGIEKVAFEVLLQVGFGREAGGRRFEVHP